MQLLAAKFAQIATVIDTTNAQILFTDRLNPNDLNLYGFIATAAQLSDTP